ncbi:MAG: PH domain-containing protein [Candidatus Saccharimonadales bacterium]
MAGQFEGQHQDEEVIFTFRRHPIAMRKGFYALLIPFLVASLPVLIWPDNLAYLGLAFGGLAVGIILFFYHWMGWYFSIFIVTDQRLRQITQKGFFNRSVIDLGISKIQNISYNVPGFSAAMLGYGTIVVQTYVGDLYLDRIHKPGKIYNDLTDTIRQHGGEGSTFISQEDDT